MISSCFPSIRTGSKDPSARENPFRCDSFPLQTVRIEVKKQLEHTFFNFNIKNRLCVNVFLNIIASEFKQRKSSRYLDLYLND